MGRALISGTLQRSVPGDLLGEFMREGRSGVDAKVSGLAAMGLVKSLCERRAQEEEV